MILLPFILGTLFFVLVILFFITRRKMKNLANIPENKKILPLTDRNFSESIKKGVVLVDFWAPWCMPCKLMIPVLNDLAEEVDGKVFIGKLNVDEARVTAGKFKIRSIPTLILFKNGKEIQRFMGVKTKEFLLKELDRINLE